MKCSCLVSDKSKSDYLLVKAGIYTAWLLSVGQSQLSLLISSHSQMSIKSECLHIFLWEVFVFVMFLAYQRLQSVQDCILICLQTFYNIPYIPSIMGRLFDIPYIPFYLWEGKEILQFYNSYIYIDSFDHSFSKSVTLLAVAKTLPSILPRLT